MKKKDAAVLQQLKARIDEAKVEAALEVNPDRKRELLIDVEKSEELVQKLKEELERDD